MATRDHIASGDEITPAPRTLTGGRLTRFLAETQGGLALPGQAGTRADAAQDRRSTAGREGGEAPWHDPATTTDQPSHRDRAPRQDQPSEGQDRIGARRDVPAADRRQLLRERDRLKATVRRLERNLERQRRKSRRFRHWALILSLPSLVVLSPVLLPWLGLRRLRRRGQAMAGHARTAETAGAAALPDAPQPDPPQPDAPDHRRVLVDANALARAGDHAGAIAMAQARLPAELAHTVNILRANAAIAAGRPEEWQDHVNAYLAHFDAAPIRLEGTGSVFDRLSAAPPPAVTGGPLVSVIMPAWNAEKTVRKAALSILDQSWRNLELLIVDDCSTDGTWAALQALAAADDRVKILRNTVNVGPYVSKNIAASQARGDWITGHDADDWAHPERIARQLRVCEDEGLTACLSGMLRVAGTGEFVRLNPIRGFVHDGACRSAFISLMIRGQYFRDVLGGWDTVRTGGDSELLRRIEALQGKPVRQLACVTMFCLDNPDGLTNDPVFGYSETTGVSCYRLAYRSAFENWHAAVGLADARLDMRSPQRPFEAPPEIAAAPSDIAAVLDGHRASGLHFGREIEADAVLITNMCFPGGNASSTLDELRWFEERGLSYALVHCPTDRNSGRDICPRYAPYRDRWRNWSEVDRITCRVLICRHPAVVTSRLFEGLLPKIKAEHAFIVVNNSRLRQDGSPVYRVDDLVGTGQRIDAKTVSFCPISPAMRKELDAFARASGRKIRLSATDWTPTFDLSLYHQPPKPHMRPPFRIGRHARDGAEKWLENGETLQRAYPEDADFAVSILGGAKRADSILKGLPANWTVHDFGSIEPFDYLSRLDAFVYFPASSLVEAFGRTSVEAMLAGVPVILPRRFAATFGDLALYCDAAQVADMVRRLARDDGARVAYLADVQRIAAARYANGAIARRLAETGLATRDVPEGPDALALSDASRAFRDWLMAQAHKTP